MIEEYRQLIAQAEATFGEGRMEEAAELFASAQRLAEGHGDQELADRAFCNRCAVLIELDRGAAHIPQLKTILLRSRETTTRFLASYYTAMAYDLDDEGERAATYAQRAMGLAEQLEDTGYRARAANLAGNLALRSSRFDDAEAAYSRALASHTGSEGYHQIMEAQERDNLGYVLICTGRVNEGIRLCEEALEELESLRAEHYLAQPLQDLCYGHLMSDELEQAERAGHRALEYAIADHDDLIAKNCLFLLSEVAVRRGDTFRARRFLRELANHYSEIEVSEEIIDVFLATDLTTVVNLRG